MKSKLAINGGCKTISTTRTHFIWPPISNKTRDIVLQQLDESISIYNRSGIIEKLEIQFCNYHNRKHSLLTNSGTSALLSMFIGANLQEGDEIICPAYTFYATISPIFFTGAVPILAECEEDGNINPNSVEEKITDKTKAIIITHMWGLPCKMTELCEIAKKYGLLLFEDASHAHGAIYNGMKVGSFGDASAFSLQGQKTLTGGEGGVLLTNNDELFYRALLLGHYNKRCKTEIPKDYSLSNFSVTGMGLKLRIHPVAAAIASQQFNELETVLVGRQKFAKLMSDELGKLPGIRVPEVPDNVRHTWYAFVMKYDSNELSGLPIDKFYAALLAEGCKELDRPDSTCPLNYHPLFQNPTALFPKYQGKLSYQKGDFPIAEKFHENSLKLPVWNNFDDEEIVQLYIKAFQKVVENHKELL